jgi:hypothetical protein
MPIINNDKEALTHALILGITAPDYKLQEVMELAQEIANKLSDAEIQECKDKAIAWIDEQELKAREANGDTIH